ncbi:MAG TPA: hypothetical protein VH857_05365 [Actinomycetes bacterium]|nr:hypothetical protein [Actinomycetes bacterium]
MTGAVATLHGRPSGRRGTVVLAAAAAVLLVVVAAVVVRTTRDQSNGLPSFNPRPLTGATALHSQLGPGVRFDVPKTRFVEQDTPGILVLKFNDRTQGGLIAMRVASYPAGWGRDLARDVRRDNRVHIVSASGATVAGEPATRLVVNPVPGITAAPWFCPVGGRPCMDINATGGNTLYVFNHRGQRYMLVGGSLNADMTRAMRPVVDGAAATWQW